MSVSSKNNTGSAKGSCCQPKGGKKGAPKQAVVPTGCGCCPCESPTCTCDPCTCSGK